MSSTVELRHPQYEDVEYQWRQLRDCIAGTSAIKRSGALYLPIPTAMLVADRIPAGTPDDSGIQFGGRNTKNTDEFLRNRAPWNHPIAAYSAYLQRARFPDITSNCQAGLVGIATKKDPEVELTPSLEHLQKDATVHGLSLNAMFKEAIGEVLSTGRCSYLTDVVESENILKFVKYDAESQINWKTVAVDGEIQPFLIVFEEHATNGSEFSHEAVAIHRVLRIEQDESGAFSYTSQLYNGGQAAGESVIVTLQGQSIDFIPNVCINADEIGYVVGESPLLGISDIAISVYQKDADMSNAEFLTCNPMLAVFGVDENDVPQTVGSAVAWAIGSPEGRMEYIEPAATSLNHMQNRIDKLFEEAISYGMALLGPTNKVEAEGTVRMRQEASGATLKTVVRTVGEGIERALKQAAEWAGDNPDDIKFEPNLSFSDVFISAPEQAALLQSWLNRGISHETFLWNMKKGSIIPEDISVEDEQARIFTSAPVLNTGTPNLQAPLNTETSHNSSHLDDEDAETFRA